MTNTEFHGNNLIFGLEDNPPFQTAFLVSLQEALAGFPEQLRNVLESGISVGSLCALILNLVLPKLQSDRLAEESVSQPETSSIT